MDRLLSIEEAARELGGLSIWTVRAWLSQGRMKRTKVGGRTMIRESELRRVIVDAEDPNAVIRSGSKACTKDL
jgi:excisionase family DNA binding protein